MSDSDERNPELHDRLLDLALRENLGGESPPDFVERILDAQLVPAKVEEPKMKTRRYMPNFLELAIATSLLVGVGWLLYPSVSTDRSVALIQKSSQLPSPYYQTDDIQYFRPEDHLSVRLSEEAKGKITAGDGISNPKGKSLVRSVGQQSEPRPATDVQVGVPFRQNSFGERRDEVLRSINPPIVVTRDGIVKLLEMEAISPEEAEQGLNRLDELDFLRLESEAAESRGADRGGDQYTRIHENPFVEAVGERATSTFSIDVDTASYANVRQFLTQSNTLPPPDAVRIEELINYFDYNYAGLESANPSQNSKTPSPNPSPADGGGGLVPFSSHVEIAGCPWNSEHRLVRIGIKGREIENDKRPLSNLVFLIDVSGSMNQPNKLPLVVKGLQELTRELGENDRVAIVVYASSEGLVLDSTPGTEQKTILAALEQLQAGGSTAGGAGIRLAYQLAEDHFIKGGVNRVILCTDGDFNVGTTSTGELERLVQDKAKGTGVFLSVLGFGRGNLNDSMMETISNHGNGNYHYVDNFREARRVLVEEMTGTLVTIAKDVKIQVFFNPAQVAGYRLIGYENRMLKTQDFNDDTKDAGEIGAGHTVTALYEIVPSGGSLNTSLNMPAIDQSPYVKQVDEKANDNDSNELLTLRMRYKQPDGDKSSLLEWPITDNQQKFGEATGDFKFATAVAGFGMLLRDSQHRGNATWDAMLEIATGGTGDDPTGRRAELVDLIRKAKELNGEIEE